MGIYKYEDGSIGTAYEKNFDGEYPEVDFPSLEEVVEYIENADTWDCVDHGVYRELCDEVGLDCDDYDDPEALMEDVRARMEPQRRFAVVSYVYRGEAAKKNGEGCDIFYDRLPENFTIDQAVEKADTEWESLHWRDKQKERISLCIINNYTEDILDVVKEYE